MHVLYVIIAVSGIIRHVSNLLNSATSNKTNENNNNNNYYYYN